DCQLRYDRYRVNLTMFRSYRNRNDQLHKYESEIFSVFILFDTICIDQPLNSLRIREPAVALRRLVALISERYREQSSPVNPYWIQRHQLKWDGTGWKQLVIVDFLPKHLSPCPVG